MKRIFTFIFLGVIFLGCATTANYEKILNTWVGAHVDHLITTWGPPQSSFQLSDGGSVIEYVNSRNVQTGGYTYTTPQTTYHYGSTSYGTYSGYSTTNVQQQTPIYNINLYCRTRFTINPQGIITRWSWQGNACKAKSPE